MPPFQRNSHSYAAQEKEPKFYTVILTDGVSVAEITCRLFKALGPFFRQGTMDRRNALFQACGDGTEATFFRFNAPLPAAHAAAKALGGLAEITDEEGNSIHPPRPPLLRRARGRLLLVFGK